MNDVIVKDLRSTIYRLGLNESPDRHDEATPTAFTRPISHCLFDKMIPSKQEQPLFPIPFAFGEPLNLVGEWDLLLEKQTRYLAECKLCLKW